MNFEVNKIAGAVLGTMLFAMGSGFLAELIYEPKAAGDRGYKLPEPEPKAAGGGTAEPAKVEPIATRLAAADAAKGEAGTKACKGCHSFDKASANGIGPGLWDVVERAKGSHAGFNYSASLKEKGGAWTYEDLDYFIEKPKGFIKDTKMVFPGIASPQERANVIAYLRSLSDSPKPLPVAEKKDEAAKPAETKPAETKPAAAEKPDSPPAGSAKPEESAKPQSEPKAADPAPAEAPPAPPKPESAPPAEPGAPAERSEDKPAETAPADPAPAEKPAQQ